jgi:hypothetical protein
MKIRQCVMPVQLYFRPVVESRPTNRAIVHAKSRDTDNVKRDIERCAQASDVPCVRRNLWFD